METGFKVFRGELIREIAPKLKSKRFGFEPEITARIAKIKGIRIYEVGLSYWGRTYEEGKKIGWRDGLKAIWLGNNKLQSFSLTNPVTKKISSFYFRLCHNFLLRPPFSKEKDFFKKGKNQMATASQAIKKENKASLNRGNKKALTKKITKI